MSQGELHSLALSLFFPRATLDESPFRFVVIDDPVQSMDPSKVDGLARVLERAGKQRQVIVFTHDDRLPEALVAARPRLARRLAAKTLGRVLDLDDEERQVLLETLQAWFRADRSATRAGELLYCHRNTVLNRLRKLEQLTGASLEDDRHQLSCRLALMAYRNVLPSPSPT
jgi:DNA-binding PucR family transcriptional regulator